MTTSLSVLTLEVYYRYLPLFRLDIQPERPATAPPAVSPPLPRTRGGPGG